MFVHFIHHGDWFYTRYINSTIRTKYIDDDGTGLKPKQFFQNNTQKKCVGMEVICTVQEGRCGIKI